MKKFVALLLAFVLVFSMTSCGKEKEFNASKRAYETINEAYEMVNEFSQDIYEAWRMGINEKERIDGTYEEGYYYTYTYYDDRESLIAFAKELHIPAEDLEAAVAKLLEKDEYDPGSKRDAGDWYYLSHVAYTSFFSACVNLVSTAYEINGKADEIIELLENAKEQMKELSDDYSDYEHYPNLKEYFTTTTAFFGFCMDPEGSFDQVVETLSNYRNRARDCYYDLNYVFEDSIFPEDDEDED